MQIIAKVNSLRKGSLLYRCLRYRKGFGVHSPFVFDLITKVIEEKYAYYCFQDLELLRKKLSFNTGEITYTDRKEKGGRKTRSVGEIVRRESIRPKQGALLFRLTNYFKPRNILQIGTTTGLSTLYLTSYATGLRCVALENIPEFAPIARQAFAKGGRNPIDLRVGNYMDLLPKALKEMTSLDFVFFNAPYERQDNLRLFNACMKYARNDTVFVLAGIKANREMRDLWEEIQACPEVTVTLDLYSLGIVLLNRKLHKRDYIVYF